MIFLVGLAHATDFSGHWTLTGVVPDMGSGWGKSLTVTQSATELVVEYVYYAKGDLQPPMHFSFALNGVATNRILTEMGTQEETTTATWRGDALELTTVGSFADPGSGARVPVTTTRTLSLTVDGLQVDVVRHGVLGAKDVVTRTVYARE